MGITIDWSQGIILYFTPGHMKKEVLMRYGLMELRKLGREEQDRIVQGARLGKYFDWKMIENYIKSVVDNKANLKNKTLKTQQDIEDFCQDICLQIKIKMHRFEGRSKFSTWVYRIVINKLYDQLRKNKTQGKIIGNFEKFELEALADPALDQSKLLEKKEEEDLLYKAMENLPTEMTLVLYYRVHLRYPVPKIAKEMQIEESTVRKLLKIARPKLRDEYNKLINQRGIGDRDEGQKKPEAIKSDMS